MGYTHRSHYTKEKRHISLGILLSKANGEIKLPHGALTEVSTEKGIHRNTLRTIFHCSWQDNQQQVAKHLWMKNSYHLRTHEDTLSTSLKTRLCLLGWLMMIILHGDTIEQLTFILSESRAALAVTNLSRGSRQTHTEQL